MNEFDRIKQLRALVQRSGSSAGLIQGIGDDAAVFRSAAANHVVVTTDLLVEDVDFRRDTTRPDLLGHKALAVSLSDIAAMGARPRWALLSIGVTEDVWNSDFLDQFFSGFFKLADRYGVTLIGGDLSRTTSKIVIDSIVIGECPGGRELYRSGAKAGDQIFVTGYLGDAAAGLRLIERGSRLTPDLEGKHPVNNLLLRQLQPEPRVGWGLMLGEKQLASAMIDISDGLSSDLTHLCDESGVGAIIEASRLPIDEVVAEICGRRKLDPLMLALHGGEDYELLFTVSPKNVKQLPSRVDGVSITRIGEIKSAEEGVRIAEGSRVWKLEPGGWEHFRKE